MEYARQSRPSWSGQMARRRWRKREREGERGRGGVEERGRAAILHEISQAECFVFSAPSFITVVKHQKAHHAWLSPTRGGECIINIKKANTSEKDEKKTRKARDTHWGKQHLPTSEVGKRDLTGKRVCASYRLFMNRANAINAKGVCGLNAAPLWFNWWMSSWIRPQMILPLG